MIAVHVNHVNAVEGRSTSNSLASFKFERSMNMTPSSSLSMSSWK